MDELLSVKQVSDWLQAQIMSVYKLIRMSKLRATRVLGVGLRIEAMELERFFSQNKRRTHPKSRKAANAKPKR